jgi:hypothetical protein
LMKSAHRVLRTTPMKPNRNYEAGNKKIKK